MMPLSAKCVGHFVKYSLYERTQCRNQQSKQCYDKYLWSANTEPTDRHLHCAYLATEHHRRGPSLKIFLSCDHEGVTITTIYSVNEEKDALQ